MRDMVARRVVERCDEAARCRPVRHGKAVCHGMGRIDFEEATSLFPTGAYIGNLARG
ncbi:hypothetical protein [Actinosynnema sp. NPDC020468]|uniref:hypothetical protein n=1 Tax=Actinosynnema sp. NPDC020468 TaxID=3154488 RepID=UPI0033CF8A2F